MSDRILGPAYPALLAPGLRVWLAVEVEDPAAEPPDTPIVLLGPAQGPDWVGAWLDEDDQSVEWEHLDPADLRIDYADPHTRDRVARALEAHDWPNLPRQWVGGFVHRRGEPPTPEGLRAVAAAVWGGA